MLWLYLGAAWPLISVIVGVPVGHMIRRMGN
jgi:hypothetical protein